MKNIKPGTPKEYAAAMKIMIEAGQELETLNRANHAALASGQITLAHFQAAAQVLAAEILKR